MAHHQHQQADGTRRESAMQTMLKIFHLSSTPTVPLGEDELNGETDEPPDDQVSPLSTTLQHHESIYKRSRPTLDNDRRQSLLTRAIMASHSDEHESTSRHPPRGLSTASSHSTGSVASTAELTSDGNLTSPPQSSTPSPSFPATHYNHLPLAKSDMLPPRLIIAPETKDDLPIVAPVAAVGEAAIEKTLGRKRCIMFACGGNTMEKTKEVVESKKETEVAAQAPKRKSMLTFACPSRAFAKEKREDSVTPVRRSSPTPAITTSSKDSPPGQQDSASDSKSQQQTPLSPTSRIIFHEFGSSNDEPDSWVDQPTDHKRKLTLTDCMKKEYAIRQLGEEAEKEAEQEEEEQDDLEDELEDETAREDDFAPSDDSSDAGNDSDDEAGFAESDDESDAGSDYQFWAPSTTTAATSTDNINISHFSSRQRSIASSPESTPSTSGWAGPPPPVRRTPSKQRARLARMRPSTPELPDSTDFVCGTLDEDRPLEQAYISCREQRKREKHVPIPQDIDPSFPTTDPEDNDDDDNVDAEDTDDHLWLKDQLNGFDEENGRGRRKSSTIRGSPPPRLPTQTVRPIAVRPTLRHSPPAKHNAHRSPPPKSRMPRSPIPKTRMAKSPPPPRRLFGHSPSRLRSPPPPKRLNSPRGSPDNRQRTDVGLNVSKLAQRPNMGRTASLPRKPNPFFRNYSSKDLVVSTVTSGTVSPGGGSDQPRPDMHVRGPVDIVIGLENKRQKRKEKFWRQHCRKTAKEQAQRRPYPGRGAERMKELGLECAERARGYGIGQPAQLVLSL